MNHEERVYCGVDVSKDHLDVLVKGRPAQFENTAKGVRSMVARIGKAHYVLESTGGYERMAAWLLMDAGLAASIVNPSRVRHYALGMGQLAKTDPIDAGVITEFARATRPEPSEKPSKTQRLLVALVDRRQQLMDMRTAESNRLETAAGPEFRKMVEKHLRWIEKEIEALEKRIDETVRADESMEAKARCIRRIQGLGAVCTATLLAHLPEIGTLSRQEAAALTGLAPYNRDSGKSSKQRHICGGRRRLRACLYMGAISAIQHNPHLKEFYRRLVEENHRPKKVALTAVMRKLVIAANSAVKNPDFCVVV
ncbi:MAG: IS110 family transposase [Verrucomicrobia bacterium]|nr:MAG: IS110 family transposase [Verrucomicrobiota bacterium]